MREYKVEIEDEEYIEQAGRFSVALVRAMRKFEKKLKSSWIRSKVGQWFRVDIERVK